MDYNAYDEMNFTKVSTKDIDARVSFIRKTYAHLTGAVLGFAGLEVLLFKSGAAYAMLKAMSGVPYVWALVLGMFVLVGWVADWWANNMESRPLQYLGLALYVVAEALVFVPLMFMATAYSDAWVLPSAAITTLTTFAGLTVAVFTTKKDFSFMRSALIAGSFLSLGVIGASIMFGFQLGIFFSAAMVLLASGSILYNTSNILHHYRTDQHVAASLSLFSSVALLFWYILRIFMSRN
jgi:uncharacterized protein